MKKDVRLFIKGTHISANPQVNEEEPFENADEIFTQTSGIYHAKDGKHYIRYEEIQDDGRQTSGCILKIDGKNVELIKKGYGATHLYFEEGKTCYTYYQTVIGKLFIGVNAKTIAIEESEEEIAMKIEYELMMNEEKAADSSIEIKIIF
ncbi:MAG: DUF1934 domain-containing protein [Lachnospiraceae bacterium]|nr:DUF1934 domain-containing protein [Lachnospiraceae bacterium]